MGGIFGVVSKKDCVADLFFGTDYHSHLGTRRGGMAVYDKEEGFDRIAYLFKAVGDIEKEHEERYLALLANIEGETVFKKEEPVKWQCGNCGHIHVGPTAPGVCPVCDHPQSYFRVRAENY